MRRLLPMLAAVALIVAACGGTDAPKATPTTSSATLPASQPLPAELQTMLTDVAAVRGLPPPTSLKGGVVARKDVPALLDALLTDDDRRWFETTTTLYRLLGHLRPDQDYLSVYRELVGQAGAGFYSPERDELWLVTQDGGGFALDSLSRDEKRSLAHELVHAVQDASFNLDALHDAADDDLDAGLALSSLIEGDAVTHEGLYAAKHLAALPPGTKVLLASAGPALDVPASISRELFFPYTTGAEWVQRVGESGGSASVDALFRDPPRTTAQVLHPELAASWQAEAASLPDLAGALGSGWAKESGGTFGEFQVRNYLQLRLPGVPASLAAAGWRGDRYDVYRKGGESVAVFRLKFADSAQAQEFASTHASFFAAARSKASQDGAFEVHEVPAGSTTVTLAASGADVVFVIGSSRDVALRAARLLGGG